MKHYTIHPVVSEKNIELHRFPDDLRGIYKPAAGIPMGETYDPCHFDVAPERSGKSISDFIENAYGYLMVSTKAKDAFQNNVTAPIEYLPFKIRNRKGKTEPGIFHILNVIGTRQCLDAKRTEGELKSGSTERYMRLTRIFLDVTIAPTDVNIFRIQQYPEAIIVREDLVTILRSTGLTGVEFIPVGEKICI